MRIVILGGSGFIGKALAHELAGRGHEVLVPSRNAARAEAALAGTAHALSWDGADPDTLARCIDGADAVVNLIGANIAERRWTQAQKARIVDSRVRAGVALATAVERTPHPPRVLVQGSAVGYYGGWQETLTAPVRTEDAPAGTGFLASTCTQWEASSAAVEAAGVRRCVIRSGVVIGPAGGALAKMLPPFRFFVGGPPGTGRQPFPWIHLHDEVRAIMHLIDRPDLEGAFNLTAPGRTSMRTFCKVLGRVLRRPSSFRVPAFLLRLLLGEMADEMLLSGQVAPPERLTASGFTFTYPTPETALEAVLRPAPQERSLHAL